MPNIHCGNSNCVFNKNGQCDNDEIELDYSGICQSSEDK